MKKSRKRQILLASAATAVTGAATAGIALWRRRNRRHARVGGRPEPVQPVTQSMVGSNPADMNLGQPGRNLDRRLDEGIHETFPASDPVSIRVDS